MLIIAFVPGETKKKRGGNVRSNSCTLPEVKNGNVTDATPKDFPGKIANVTCDLTYELIGEPTITCLNHEGEWSDGPSCYKGKVPNKSEYVSMYF